MAIIRGMVAVTDVGDIPGDMAGELLASFDCALCADVSCDGWSGTGGGGIPAGDECLDIANCCSSDALACSPPLSADDIMGGCGIWNGGGSPAVVPFPPTAKL